MKCAILCGGLATRLRPLTDNLPKSLIDVNGRPFIAWQLELLKQQGITDIVLCVGHLGQMIQDVVGDGSQYGVNVVYSSDGDTPLGTAGALRKALPLLGDTFFVMYGDAYPLCSFQEVDEFLEPQFDAVMTVIRNDNPRHQNNVYIHEANLALYDKRYPTPRMCHLDYGLSVVRDYAINHDASGYSDLSDVFHHISASGFLDGFEVDSSLYNIGSPLGLEELRDYLKETA